MKTRVMFLLTAVIVGSLSVPAGFAQRGGGGGGGRMSGGGGGRMSGGGGRMPGGGAAISRPIQPGVMRTNPLNSPSSPIAPMTNPVAPFANYNQTPRPPVANATGRGRVDGGRFDGRHDGGRFNNDIVVVGGGGYYPGYYGGYYGGYGGYGLDPFYGPVLNPAPIPGQVPYTYGLPLWNPPTIPGQLPNTFGYAPDQPTALVAPVEAPPIITPDPIYYPEQRTIVPTEPLVPIKELPNIGSTRAQVEAKYGEPWGVMAVNGQEKVYFRGMMVVFEQGQVVEVQRR